MNEKQEKRTTPYVDRIKLKIGDQVFEFKNINLYRYAIYTGGSTYVTEPIALGKDTLDVLGYAFSGYFREIHIVCNINVSTNREVVTTPVDVKRIEVDTVLDVDISVVDIAVSFDTSTPMESNMERRVVCAAIRADDGDFILGVRHYNEIIGKQIDARPDGEKFMHRTGDDQGFVDNYGVYMTRKEAYDVALKADQIIRPECVGPEGLFSEALY